MKLLSKYFLILTIGLAINACSNSSSPTPDTTPDSFLFIDQVDTELNTIIVSSSITISGINSTTDISISDGEYSINNSNYTNANGTISNGQSITVRHTSSNSYSTSVISILTIGGVSATFSSTTLSATDTTPNAFSFVDQTDVAINSLIESSTITVSGIATSTSINITGGEYSIDAGAYTNLAGTINSGQTVTVRHTSSSSYLTTVNTLLSIGNVDDTFSTTTFSGIIDITDAIFNNQSANCADYVESYNSTSLDVHNSVTFNGSLTITSGASKCTYSTNGIPNHSFNDGSQAFAHNVSAQNLTYQTTTTPTVAASVTELDLSVDNAIFLNGVKLDLLPAACFNVGDGKSGCNDMAEPWRYDPMYAANGFATDSHNAHAQPDGAYHYHGSPKAMYYSDTVVVSPVVGFAADGFPIFGTYFNDAGTIRKATSSYQLKSGARVAISGINPGGTYDGTFRDDYEYTAASGDLDECNGMTVNGVYGYYITETFPWVLKCLKGTVDPSFNKF